MFVQTFIMAVWKQVLFGQTVAFCLSGVGIFSKLLAMNGYYHSSVQIILAYVLMALMLLRARPWKCGLSNEWWRYIILAAVDFRGNFMYSSAFRYTSATSVRMMVGFTVPGTVILGYIVFGRMISRKQAFAMVIAIAGLALNIASDFVNDPASSNAPENGNRLVGCLSAFAAAICYSVTNIYQEWLVKRAGKQVYADIDQTTLSFEIVGMLGLFGAILGFFESLLLEPEAVTFTNTLPANAYIYITCFALCMTTFYIGLSLFLRKHDASILNLNLLTTSVDILIFESFYLRRFRAHDWMYALAFVLSLSGAAYFHTLGYIRKIKDRSAVLPVAV